jgi:hypothetical protein
METLEISLWIVRSACGEQYVYQPNLSSTISQVEVEKLIKEETPQLFDRTDEQFGQVLGLRGWEIVRCDLEVEFPALVTKLKKTAHCRGVGHGTDRLPMHGPLLGILLEPEAVVKGYSHCRSDLIRKLDQALTCTDAEAADAATIGLAHAWTNYSFGYESQDQAAIDRLKSAGKSFKTIENKMLAQGLKIDTCELLERIVLLNDAIDETVHAMTEALE